MVVFADQGRDELRRSYAAAWRKRLGGQILQPLEAQIVAVIELHPEYHAWLAHPDAHTGDFPPEGGVQNPYLHMGLHLAIRDQVATDRPAGIARVHRRLVKKRGDPHAAEHAMAECLAAAIREAQRGHAAPDEAAYLESLRRLV